MLLYGIIEENSVLVICDFIVNLWNDEFEISCFIEYVDDGKDMEVFFEVFKFLGDGNESSRGGYFLVDVNEFFDRILFVYEDLYFVDGMF